MQIRRYNPGEEEEIWQLYFNTTHIILGQVYTRAQVERWAPHDKDMEEWKERLRKKKPFVAIDKNRIIGFAELDPDGRIDSLYAHHNWQGKGVGSALYSAIEAEAIRQKIPSLDAEVSLVAKKFFTRQGFEILEERHNIICGDPAPNYIMRKLLSLTQ